MSNRKITLIAIDNHGKPYPYETTGAELAAENASLRKELAACEDVYTLHTNKLRAKLAWFEDFATVASVVTERFMGASGSGSDVIGALDELVAWEREHPKPSEGT